MKRHFLFAVAAFAMAVLSACASAPTPADYAAQTPRLDLKSYFDGDITAHGLFTDRAGKRAAEQGRDEQVRHSSGRGHARFL